MSTPKRVSDMTPEERLASLQQWAEEQKYVTPGTCGTLSTWGRSHTYAGEVYSGPVKFVNHQYSAPLAPPSYETAVAASAKEKNKKTGPIDKWLQKRKLKRSSPNEVQRQDS